MTCPSSYKQESIHKSESDELPLFFFTCYLCNIILISANGSYFNFFLLFLVDLKLKLLYNIVISLNWRSF